MINLTPEQLRALQMKELELLIEVDRICRKHHIEYSLDGGTLLGAIRHAGFIPWDDDADIMMTRSEYNRFFQVCKTELNAEKYFLQEFETDSEYRWGYSKLRCNGTVFLREGQERIRCHTGICIDVFIFDNVPDGWLKRRWYKMIGFLVRKGLYSVVGKRKEHNKIKKLCYVVLSCFKRKTWERLLKQLYIKENQKDTKLVSHLTYPNRASIRYGVSSDYYKEYIDWEYEGISLRIIKGYDAYLKDLFDDYMELPPVEKRKVHPISELKL